ncbi:MAG: 60 kDa inner rane insertion protein [Candidatus Saccharibacteria bacterium]|nr:60 kDa inner rane insertion protein [Candidatus Saccharibacteria bacterium]
MNIFDVLIVQPIFNLLVGLYSLIPGGDFGIALIIFTVLVRFALWPLVKRQLHQVTAMRKLQPELAKIKKNSGGNKQLESVQMMDLYKKNGVNPFRSIGILLIQLPIFIALYQVIQIFTLHRDQVGKYTYDFLENIGPIKQLIAHPENFHEKLFGFIDLTQHAIGTNGTINLFLVAIALIAAGMQYIMSKQTMPQNTGKKRLRDIMNEAADGKKADQAEMNAIVTGKMIKFLPFLMLFVMLNLPGALALYYAVSNIVAVLQQRYILKKDVDEMEEMVEEAPKVIGKKATAKARAKAATEGNVIRITAKDSRPRKERS